MLRAPFDAESESTQLLSCHLDHPLLRLSWCSRPVVVVVQVVRVGGHRSAETARSGGGGEVVIGRGHSILGLLLLPVETEQFHGQVQLGRFWVPFAIADSVERGR